MFADTGTVVCESVPSNELILFSRRCVYTFLSQRFSCIIGPNGSGKSNVIDSMLFVFGYRAQKIRSKKLSVLIHSSDAHPDVQSCTVEVHFQKIVDKVSQPSDEEHTSTDSALSTVNSRFHFKDTRNMIIFK